jgi:hypothetical protein
MVVIITIIVITRQGAEGDLMALGYIPADLAVDTVIIPEIIAGIADDVGGPTLGRAGGDPTHYGGSSSAGTGR